MTRLPPNYELLAGLREAFEARQPRRRDVGQSDAPLPEDARFLFVPLQVPDDSQMILFAGWCGGLEGFIRRAGGRPRRPYPKAGICGSRSTLRRNAPSARASSGISRRARGWSSTTRATASPSSKRARRSSDREQLDGAPSYVLRQAGNRPPARPSSPSRGVAHPAGSPQELAQLLADPDALGHDGDLRARFLTWLAHDYKQSTSTERR